MDRAEIPVFPLRTTSLAKFSGATQADSAAQNDPALIETYRHRKAVFWP